MLLHDKIWVIKNEFDNNTIELANKLGISNITAGLLTNRGIDTFDKAVSFLETDRNHLNTSLLSKDINNCDWIEENPNIQELKIDMELTIKDIGFDLIDEIKKLGSFGYNNPKPLFCYRKIRLLSVNFFGDKNQHIKLEVEDEGRILDCIGFNLGKANETLSRGEEIDIAFSLGIDSFKGIETIQLYLIDIRRRCEEGYKASSLVHAYYWSFPNLFNNCQYKEMEFSLDNVVDLRNIKNRAKYVIENIELSSNNLILVNTIEGLIDLSLFLWDINKFDIIESISFNFSKNDNYDNIIIVNPILNKLDFEKYENIYIYDVPVIKEEIDFLINYGEKVHCLYNKNDIKILRKFLKNTIPNRDDLAEIYIYLKQFSDTNEMSYENMMNDLSNMNFAKLSFSLYILWELKLIVYDHTKEKVDVELLPPPEEKIDIAATELYKRVTGVIKDFKNYSKVIF